jgi:hypothetical protein
VTIALTGLKKLHELPEKHFGNFELFAAQRTLHRRIPAKIRFEGLACKERLGGCTQPDGDRLRSWIGTAEHTISKITRPPQTGFHSGRRFDAAFRRFNRGQASRHPIHLWRGSPDRALRPTVPILLRPISPERCRNAEKAPHRAVLMLHPTRAVGYDRLL